MADRWVEIDLDWFEPEEWEDSAALLARRAAPLLRAGERRGVVLNVGWLSDVVLLWSGDAGQRLPLLSRRYERWSARTYADLAALVRCLRSALAEQGVPDAAVGIFTVGWGEFILPEATAEIYDLRSEWKARQPDLYMHRVTQIPGNDLDPRVPLRTDSHRYASRPDGIRAGERFADFLADQWGHLSRAVGLDVLHLRDGWLGPLVYRRLGPWGTSVAPDPDDLQSWTAELTHLVRAVKGANREALLLLYSSAMSPTVEWTVGGIDLEAVLGVEAVDAFVDQTWGGAWQDWWPAPALGWTFQLANMAAHAAVIRRASRHRQNECRHYRLVETWDGWEPWDTLHRTPEKLRWGMWATAHAGAITPEGPRGADGAYISWLNDPRRQLMSESDVAFVLSALEETEASAAGLQAVHGVALVHDRDGIRDALDRAPGQNHSGWGEESAAMAAKWGLPVLAAVHAHDLAATGGHDGPAVAHLPDGLVWPLPGPASGDVLRTLDASGGVDPRPVLLQGRSDLVPPDTAEQAGVRPGPEQPPGFVRTAQTRGLAGGYDTEYLPHRRLVEASGAQVLRETVDGAPLLLRNGRLLYWATPDWCDPGDARIDHEQLGSLTSFRVVAEQIAGMLEANGRTHVDQRAEHDALTICSWTSGDRLHILLGNLETGWTGDSRWPRTVVLSVSAHHLAGGTHLEDETGAALHPSGGDGRLVRFELVVPPEGMRLLRSPS